MKIPNCHRNGVFVYTKTASTIQRATMMQWFKKIDYRVCVRFIRLNNETTFALTRTG